MITVDDATRLSHLILLRNSEGGRWKIMDFRYPVGKTAKTSHPRLIASTRHLLDFEIYVGIGAI